jgi:hypothetical protein
MAANPQIVDYIRKAAIARGIDPEVALRVAEAEALNVFDPSKPDLGGDDRSSFGMYQLHYGGRSKKMPNPGLGDEFTAKTGLDASDPSTWKQQVDFSLDWAKKNGWGPWMGAKRIGIAPRQGLGDTKAIAPTPNTSVTTPSVLTGKKGEEVWSKPTTRVIHPPNAQTGTGGYVAPGAPDKQVVVTTPAATVEAPQMTDASSTPWSGLAGGLASALAPGSSGGMQGGSDVDLPVLATDTAMAPMAAIEPVAGDVTTPLASIFKIDPATMGQAAALNLDKAGQPIIRRQYG